MKNLFLLLTFAILLPSFAQDTTSKKVATFPKVNISKLAELQRSPKKLNTIVKGEFKIDKIFINEKSKTNKDLIKNGIGSKVFIDDSGLSGDYLESVSFTFIESESLELVDFLYRSFGKMPNNIPDDLPESVVVQKLAPSLEGPSAGYGIINMSNGTIILPYNNTILYLVRL